jgi:hypothetical protein
VLLLKGAVRRTEDWECGAFRVDVGIDPYGKLQVLFDRKTEKSSLARELFDYAV